MNSYHKVLSFRVESYYPARSDVTLRLKLSSWGGLNQESVVTSSSEGGRSCCDVGWLVPLLLLAATLSTLLLFLLLAPYAHPSADDYCMASGVREEGLWRHLWNHYLEWSGRYSGNALYALYPLLFGLIAGYGLLPVILLPLLFVATSYFLSRLFRVRLFDPTVMMMALILLSVYLLGMASSATSIYWMAGSLSYQSANILILIMLGLMLTLRDRQRHAQPYRMVWSLLLLVVWVAVGTNETAMLAITAIILLAVSVHLGVGWRPLVPWIGLLVVDLIGFAMVYFAPGNAVREGTFPLRHDLLRTLQGSLEMGGWTLINWLTHPLVLLSVLLLPFAVARLRSTARATLSNGQLVLLAAITLSLPFILQIPAWWAMGGWPPPRTVDAIFFLFLVSAIVTLSQLLLRYLPTEWWPQLKPAATGRGFWLLITLAAAFALTTWSAPRFQRAYSDLLHRAPLFHEYMTARYRLIEQTVADGERVVQVPGFIAPPPKSIYFNDILPISRYWRNRCVADYFGLDRIRREASRPVTPQE